jgi:Winged helix domain, variant/ATPase family associated with various cellular activities (AAA)
MCAEMAPKIDPGTPGGTAVATAADGPYADAWEHIRDELHRLDLRLAVRAKRERRRPDSPLDAFRGLVVSDEDAEILLDDLADARGAETIGEEAGRSADFLAAADQRIASRLVASADVVSSLPLVRLAHLCRLTSFEAQCLVICVAPELDRRYERLYGYLQDDVTRTRPTVALAIDLLCGSAEERIAARMFFDPQAPLIRYSLCRLTPLTDDAPAPLLSRSLIIDDRIVDFLLGRQRVDARLDEAVRLVMPGHVPSTIVDESMQERIRRLVESFDEGPDAGRHSPMVHLFGPAGSGTRALAEAVCGRLGIPLLVADLERLSPESVRLLAREALLLPAALCLDNFDAATHDSARAVSLLNPLLAACRTCSRLTFLAGSRSWLPPNLSADEPFFSLQVDLPELAVSQRMWEASVRAASAVADDVNFGSLASRFRLGPEQIHDVVIVAGSLARWRSPHDSRITMRDLDDACRAIGATQLTSLSRKVEPRSSWGELVLPATTLEQLQELCDQATYRHVVLGQWGFDAKLPLGRGLSALFCGPPGTGKTMAAQVIAGDLRLHLYRIDLSQVVSKYIGETEKNLRQVFDQAEATHGILFFDEADALFGKRSEVKDAHDRYANIEVGYLLQKMEEFDGIAILATNARQNLDEAFVRRLRFIVEFPFPDEEHRRRIWQVTFPHPAPLSTDVDFATLAREVRLAGGHIRNIGLAAAFAAARSGGPIQMRHLIGAVRREFEKLGRSWDESMTARLEGQTPREAASRA